jgi:hypothetical protein
MRSPSAFARFAFGMSMMLIVDVLAGCGSESSSEFVAPDAEVPDPGTSSGVFTPDPAVIGCKPKTCQELGYECGPQSDGCGTLIQCGQCPEGTFCGGGGPSKCGIGVTPDGKPPCTPKTCQDVGASCGKQGDGCGNLIDCGNCTAPTFCGGSGANQCGLGGTDGGTTCTPKTCLEMGATCGRQGDGCGNILECGSCESPAFCGGNGPNNCGLGAEDGGSICVPKTCAELGASCGTQGDGCGNVLNCGSCTSPQFCGGNGPNQCGLGGTGGGNPCVPKSCAELNATCGKQGDGCGALLDCGSCTSPQFCGGDGANHCGLGGVDGGTTCVPKTCADLGAACGAQGDGCGNVLDCGSCTAPTFCGGAGANKCGLGGADGGTTCVKRTCAQLGAECGTQADGCGGTLDCGSCQSPNFCGGKGANKCGQGAVDGGSQCVPKTCQDIGATCGQQGDGCGNLLNCGNCVSPEYCGGNGANHCGLGGANGGTACTPLTCADLGATCGSQGDGCGKTINCGTCNAPQYCGGNGPNKCGLGGTNGGSTCVAKTCAELGASCGLQGDGCGGTIDCGACSAPQYCGGNGANQCGLGGTNGGSTCVPKTCAQLGVECGVQGDGCGGQLDCGGCVAPAFCGGGGVSRCGQGGSDGGTVCKPKTCAELGATCGTQGDGCGATLNCGGCNPPQFCGGNGANKCGLGGTDGGTTCVPRTCAQLGANCGTQGNGCGGTLNCGLCSAPQFCGGDGSNRCGLGGTDGGSQCVPRTCASLGATCGQQGDGCGGILDCGSCTAPAYCGGNGANKCGLGGNDGGTTCVPRTCAQLGAECGQQGDGCGGTLNCGSCNSPDFCGGKGPNQCGQGAVDGGSQCVPKTCASLGATCGTQGDGCGNTLNCGGCTAPQFCGGNGPNRCGLGGTDGGTTCIKKTCADLGATCGTQGDGCGGTLNCGSCPSPQFCGGNGANKCGLGGTDGGTTCVAKTCTDLGATCGIQGDGCGGSLNCGNCAAPMYCGGAGANHCGLGAADGGSTCVPRTCAQAGAMCGTQSDGCGGTLNCGSCTLPAFCGGAGPNQCGQGGTDGGSLCVPRTCADLGVQCGDQGDGCGGQLDCGGCTPPTYCGGGGANRCGQGGADGGTACVPRTCAQLGATCGTQGDGCGATLNCGSCTSPQFCGGAGPNKCGLGASDGGSTCVPRTCAQLNANCGTQGDGCGSQLNCGSCSAPQFCGGGGANRCGLGGNDGGSACVPKTCAELGATCGDQGNGCGGTINCGSCTGPAFCGGNGPNKCGLGGVDGGALCVPKTCADLGFNCGPAGNGCGGTIASCGTCSGQDICGAVNPGVCGNGQPKTDAGTYVTCDSGVTTISGTVRAGTPAKFGTADPIYNATVYIPTGNVTTPTTGATCDRCTTSKSAAVTYTTGIDGKFTLTNPPVGPNVPVVIELGKWQRVINVNVQACKDNPLTADQTHLPRTRSEGNIPRMAIATGRVDVMECVLRKMGIDDGEFTNPAVARVPNNTSGQWIPTAAGRVHLYQAPNSGDGHEGARINSNTPRETTLLDNASTINAYDIALFPCQGGRDDKSNTDKDNLEAFANRGGRVFTTHFSYTWLYNRTSFAGTANWDVDDSSTDSETGVINTTFPKGAALADWLQLVGASTTRGFIPVDVVRSDFNSVVAPSQMWMSVSTGPTTSYPIHYTFNTPVGTPAADQCGRVVFSDFHVENADNASDVTFPDECDADAPLTPQEKLLEFMLFDLSSCIQQDVPTCTPRTCAQVGATCGTQGNGCGQTLNCGACSPGTTCGGGGVANQCGAPSCTPRTCAQIGVSCGPAGDGCGGPLNCGPCAANQTCGGGGTPGVCGNGTCTPRTCAQQGLNCGPAGDGCGGPLNCGTCTDLDTCGGGGTPGVCGHPNCVPRTCAQLGANCGTIGDGCGGTLQCGNCVGTDTCGGAGTPNQCGHPACTPRTCAQAGVQCGPTGDGCGGILQCGDCQLPQTCGGGGAPGLCGNGTCTPISCAAQNVECGPAGNGCGGTIANCGTCTGTNTCGGGGTPGQCGHPTCAPRSCAAQGIECGPAGDGCGANLNCGTCTNPLDTCGGGGVAGRCGHPACTKRTCAQVGAVCGTIGDGCGGTLDCGVCSDLNTCGGGGVANQCGHPTCVKRTCAQVGVQCGPAGDGCGGLLDCGPCQLPQTCGGGGTPGVCGVGTCTPTTCLAQNIECGPAGNGCNATLNCGTCTGIDTCGGGGVPGHCGHPNCVGRTCAQQGFNCGPASDGCGHILDCGTCTNPLDTCGGGGVNGQCGHGVCTSKSCSTLGIACGPANDGCGNVIQCGSCPNPLDTCGGGGVAGQCGHPNCTPLTCGQQGVQCGPAGNGCGGQIDCGQCDANKTCGGGGTPGVCGNGSCSPRTCAQQNVGCGPAGDGCGGALDCGTCTGINTCGGGGVPGQCGHPACTPKTCAQLNAQCGTIGDGCGGTLDCGDCTGLNTCGGGGTANQCGHPTCVKKTCAEIGVMCGPAGDGCGGTLDCGTCSGTNTCGGAGTPGQCGHPTCVKKTCAEQGVQCGPAGDGCGGVLDCGPCTAPQTCGGGGTPGVCGVGTCNPIGCTQQNITCGPAGDGCGHQIDCGTCTGLDTCGGGGTPGQCGHPACTPKSCAAQNITCGPAGDGCGNSIFCGNCTGNNTCGGGGVPGQCGAPTCEGRTCAQAGISCGPAGDGCGKTMDCGKCTAPDLCGAGGTPGQCGHATCTAQSCQVQNIFCGPAGDGCGNQIDCGVCPDGQTCGGGGTPGSCGIGGCTARTCSQQGIECGPAGDGCGSLLDCGTCTGLDTCGGNGVPGKCGHPACNPISCAAQNIACGPAGDGCGNTINCGDCVRPDVCGGNGVPGQCGHPPCQPRTCATQGIDCGPASDGCGNALDCGQCVAPATCGGGGESGKCGTSGVK